MKCGLKVLFVSVVRVVLMKLQEQKVDCFSLVLILKPSLVLRLGNLLLRAISQNLKVWKKNKKNISSWREKSKLNPVKMTMSEVLV